MKLPNFIIVGAMKSGTSTLGEYLRLHDEIFMPKGELHFFNRDFHKGIDFYAKYFDKASTAQLLGEKTPTYSFLPDIPEKIHKHLPDVKIIWILRDPVKRAYSNYLHSIKNGTEIKSFEYAFIHEAQRIKKNVYRGYFQRSIYINQINNYLHFFPLKSMHFIVFEDLIHKKESTLKALFSFLDVSHNYDFNVDIHSNATLLPVSKALGYSIRQLFGEGKINSFFKRYNLRKSKKPKIPPRLNQNLKAYFQPYNEILQQKYSIDISNWL